MNDIEHLKSLWAQKIKRSTTLIVPGVTYENNAGSLNNQKWFFVVGYAFRDALDIKYEQRMKNKKPYMVWTQGPIISFKEGDVFHSANSKVILQIKFANPMGWDSTINDMYLGSVTYLEHHQEINLEQSDKMCNQMQFLELLMYGKSHS